MITLIKSLGTVCYVIDGDSLRHHVIWPQVVTYSDIINERHLVKRLHFNVSVVFDGYDSGPSTQDGTHTRRRSGRVAPDIDLSRNIPVCVKMEQIISNGAKKQRLIIVLIRTLHGAGYGAIRPGIWQLLFIYSIKHIYTGIVHNEIILILFYSVALLLAKSKSRTCCLSRQPFRSPLYYRANVTVVLCEETDLIVLLLRHTPTSGSDMSISYLNEATPVIKVWNIHRCQEDIGPRLCQADRAFRKCHGGCDTTSLLYGISNNVPLKRLSADDSFMQTANGLVYMESMTVETIATVYVLMKLTTSWWDDRPLVIQSLPKKVFTSKTTVLASSLPPTSSCAELPLCQIPLVPCLLWFVHSTCRERLEVNSFLF